MKHFLFHAKISPSTYAPVVLNLRKLTVGLPVHHNGRSASAVSTAGSGNIVHSFTNGGNVGCECRSSCKKSRKTDDSHGEKVQIRGCEAIEQSLVRYVICIRRQFNKPMLDDGRSPPSKPKHGIKRQRTKMRA
jgi:hypothetical protein